MLQGGQILLLPLGNFNQLFFLIFRLWKVKKVLFLFDSLSEVHDDRRSLHQRLCSPQLRLLFLRKLRRRNTTCCCITQAMTGYLFHCLIFFWKEAAVREGRKNQLWHQLLFTSSFIANRLLPLNLAADNICSKFIVCFPRIQQEVLTTKY